MHAIFFNNHTRTSAPWSAPQHKLDGKYGVCDINAHMVVDDKDYRKHLNDVQYLSHVNLIVDTGLAGGRRPITAR